MNNLLQLRKFKADYTEFVYEQIAEFRSEKDENLLTKINPFDEKNTE